jgi:hypothetical protein
MIKPNYYYERYETLLIETQGLSPAEVGALQLIKWHAWRRWNPDREPFPSLPYDEKLFAKLCNRTRNWHRVRTAVMSVLTVEGDIAYYPPHRKEAENLTQHAHRKAAKKQNTKTKKAAVTPMERALAKQQAADQQERRDEAERKTIQTLNETPQEAQGAWDAAPAPEAGKFVYGLQGYRAVDWLNMNKLLKHPTKLKAGECVMFNVTDTGVKQYAVKVMKDGRGFAVRLPNGQFIAPD